MSSLYELIETSKLINLLVKSRDELRDLRDRQGSTEELNTAKKKVQAIKDELGTRPDYRRCYQAMGTWTFPATIQFASFELLNDLFYYKKFNYLAIDNGLLLYFNSNFESLDLTSLKVKSSFSTEIENKLIDPTEEQLVPPSIEVYDKDIQEYLQRKAKNGAQGNFQNKVGLKEIVFPVGRVNQPLELHIVPVSYWAIKNFNRHILDDNPDPVVFDLKEKSFKHIISKANHVSIPCSSALYVEVTLITADRKIVVLEKNPNLSALAHKGLSMTCTIEEGFVWTKDFQNEHLELENAIKRCLDQELDLPSDSTVDMKFYGVGLECTHLNTAIVGTAVLNVMSKDLKPKIKKSEDYGRNYRFISLEEVYDKLFASNTDEIISWHPLARMRILLTLINQGIVIPTKDADSDVIQMSTRNEIFISYSHKDDSWRSRIKGHLQAHFTSQDRNVMIWDDTHIKPGKKWDEEIKNALSRAKVAILLVSSDFLTSRYVHNNELPDIFKAAEHEGLEIIWIAIKPTKAWKKTSLSNYQCAHKDPDKTLFERTKKGQEVVLAEIAEYVADLFEVN